ncbi:MAG: RIP metalloprotease [Myxococcales bacterium]|nr:MAG: RIP metalloprotease [Myxococcales bacterium]
MDLQFLGLGAWVPRRGRSGGYARDVDSVLFKVLITVVALSVLIIIHEGGHYLAARAFGMRVLKFSIGFGPTLVRYQPKGSPTVFQVAVIPFLAYVQIAGMNPNEEVDPDDPELYPNKGLFARATTIAAGPVANYLTASAIVFGLGITNSLPPMQPTEPMQVGHVVPDSPAAQAGLQEGDVIAMANGREIHDVSELIEETAPRAGEPTLYVVEREGQVLAPISITPEDHDGRGQIGVGAKLVRIYENLGAWDAAKLSIVLPYQMTMAQLHGLAGMVKRGSTEGIGGPVMMGKMVAEAAQAGAPAFLWILMFISVALGMFNLLPMPALDGGRLIFLGYEAVTRRRANERFEMAVHAFGIVFLLGMMILVTYRDIFG